MVSKRVEEELERRRDEIEAEVLRRVEEAKKVLEAQMLEEMEKRKQEQLEEAKRREVRIFPIEIILEKHTHSILLTIPMRFQLENRYKAHANILILRTFYKSFSLQIIGKKQYTSTSLLTNVPQMLYKSMLHQKEINNHFNQWIKCIVALTSVCCR